MTNAEISLVVLDMAGTTVADEGLVEEAFVAALATVGIDADSERLPAMLDHIRATMGQSKITVFRTLMDGDEMLAAGMSEAFDHAYAAAVRRGHCRALPGAAEAIDTLRRHGKRVVLTTGFSRAVQDEILASLGWQDVADLTLCPADAGGRGRPDPDMALVALMRLGLNDVRGIATAGDTEYDVLAGLRCGAPIVAGVLTGAHTRQQLQSAGATHLLESVASLPDLILSERVFL